MKTEVAHYRDMTKNTLDTTVYKNGTIAKNSRTGLYWDGHAFHSRCSGSARLLDAPEEVATLRATYATITDRICAALNETGRVGYFFNVRRAGDSRSCDLLISIDPKIEIACTWRTNDNCIELHRNEVGGSVPNCTAYKVIQSFGDLAGVILDWTTPERRRAVLRTGPNGVDPRILKPGSKTPTFSKPPYVYEQHGDSQKFTISQEATKGIGAIAESVWGEGNAKLFVASPDLLAALLVISSDPKISAWLEANDVKALEQVRVAIAKAI
jgi:hypothetical protein